MEEIQGDFLQMCLKQGKKLRIKSKTIPSEGGMDIEMYAECVDKNGGG